MKTSVAYRSHMKPHQPACLYRSVSSKTNPRKQANRFQRLPSNTHEKPSTENDIICQGFGKIGRGFLQPATWRVSREVQPIVSCFHQTEHMLSPFVWFMKESIFMITCTSHIGSIELRCNLHVLQKTRLHAHLISMKPHGKSAKPQSFTHT